jgi:ankyrin repeat protein
MMLDIQQHNTHLHETAARKMERYARMNKHEQIFAHLNTEGVGVNQWYGSVERTLLMIAASKCSFETMEVLLTHGAAQDLQNNNGETALMIIAKGSKVKENNSQTILKVHLEPIKLLLRHGQALPDYKATLDLQNNQGETVLMIAAKNGRADICEILMNAGANIQLKNSRRKSAQDLLEKANPKCKLVLRNRLPSWSTPVASTILTSSTSEASHEPTSPTSVASPISSEQKNLQTEEDDIHVIIESITSLYDLKIVFTLLTYLYKKYDLSFDEYKKYVYKALDQTALKCISVDRDEYGLFKVHCVKYAYERNLITEVERSNILAKANIGELSQKVIELYQKVDNLQKQLNITQSCLKKMHKHYKNNRRIKSGIAYIKGIVDIVTLGMGGGFAEVIMNSLDNVIDFDSFEDVLKGIIRNDKVSSGSVAIKDRFTEENLRNRLEENICETLDKFTSDSNNTENDKRKLRELCGCFVSRTGESEVEDPRAPSMLLVPTLAQNRNVEVNPNAPHTGGIEANDHTVRSRAMKWVADHSFLLWLFVLLQLLLCFCDQEFRNILPIKTQQSSQKLSSLLPVPMLEWGKENHEPNSKTSYSRGSEAKDPRAPSVRSELILTQKTIDESNTKISHSWGSEAKKPGSPVVLSILSLAQKETDEANPSTSHVGESMVENPKVMEYMCRAEFGLDCLDYCIAPFDTHAHTDNA